MDKNQNIKGFLKNFFCIGVRHKCLKQYKQGILYFNQHKYTYALRIIRPKNDEKVLDEDETNTS